jgi:hypothetical protein
MANKNHLDILSQGIDVWNEWSYEFDDAPNLGGAYLYGADLRGADLRHANLERANLGRALLERADLEKANLGGTNLGGANLWGANLWGANLRGTNLRGTNLRGADLTTANLGKTIFFQTRLDGVKGLDAIKHRRPSNLDHFTIAEAEPPLPLSFLRGCGLPDLIINNVEALRGDAIQFYSCFISYSTANEAFAQRLHADLQDKSVRCWFAPHDIQGGRKVHEQINEAIRLHDKLVLILSESSMDSNWVEHEIRQAYKRQDKEDRRVLFPIGLVQYEALQEWELFNADMGRDLAEDIREYHIPDFSDWKDHDAYQKAFDRLLCDLRAAD